MHLLVTGATEWPPLAFHRLDELAGDDEIHHVENQTSRGTRACHPLTGGTLRLMPLALVQLRQRIAGIGPD
jgi:hypothetical protein